MGFFVKDGVNLIIDRKLNDEWIEIEENQVMNFLDDKGLTWHKNLEEDEVFVWEEEELIDGKCNVLTVQHIDNLDEFSIFCEVSN